VEAGMEYAVIPIAEEHIAGYRTAFDRVAREHRFLDYLEAPPPSIVQKLVLSNIRNNNPQFVALADKAVVGWCVIAPKPQPIYQHAGVLGMGIVEGYRGRGIGTELINAALDAARRRGLKRIELQVRENSLSAMTLFEKSGFVKEGVMRKQAFIDGEYENSVLMALLFDPA
jgi:RimJ/RimL family protein N-acetyltransferase